MSFVLIITNYVNDPMWILWNGMFINEVENVVLAIYGIILNRCGPTITCINLSLQAVKQFIFVMR
jgi:hypothetical protein